MLLVQYTIRSKQDYIFRTNRIRDIVGASINISKAWDVLAKEAEDIGIIFRRVGDDSTFSIADVIQEFDSGKVNIVELFRGGGNDTLLVDDEETYRKMNQRFSYRIALEYPGMIPMTVSVQAGDDYRKDYRALMEKADRKKNTMIPGTDDNLVPFAMVDRMTYQPYVDVDRIEGKEERITAESRGKRKTFREYIKNTEDTYIRYLDSLATKKGEESMLAIVHADGNNMGQKIRELLGEDSSYDSCVEKMREFTDKTNRIFVEKGLDAMRVCRKKLGASTKDPQSYAFRKIIADGDDITFICNARNAVEYTKAYLNAVKEESGYSSCAGICIFHSHYPVARAYHMAEQCCDNAKNAVHGEKIREESWIDFHYIHSGINGDLNEIRKAHGTDNAMARPWMIGEGSVADRSYKCMEEIVQTIKKYKIARTTIKTIGAKWETSHEDGRQEFRKLCGHKEGLKDAFDRIESNEDTLLRMLYDVYEVYDLWFREDSGCIR